ncbi:hypothetical protein CP49_21140 [Bradyrhizobium valentinum]|uniref:Uncharacterized protein n=1 Tax=Bradyrhizobium valentinum TaxID=1518501 RepID=A0A0R3LPF4_9BRAD|nr:hypothetical protein CP49_21140 [Bradyrhizobium valentinum]
MHQPDIVIDPMVANSGRAASSVKAPDPFLVAKMITQLRTKRPPNQRLLQLLEKPVCTCEVFRLLILT